MTITEISTLRKNGKLEQATAAAEELFASRPDKFSAGALYWCLYEKSKSLAGNELEELYHRMKELIDVHCPDDEIMLKSLPNVARRLPANDNLRSLADDAKNNRNALAACRRLDELFRKGELPDWFRNEYGWAIFNTLKATDVNDAPNRKYLLHNYLKLELPRPSMLHSLILREAVKVEANTPREFRIRDFIALWGLENLQPDDWQSYKSENGNVSPSLVERLAIVYAKEMVTDRVQPSPEFCQMLDKALAQNPDNEHLIRAKANIYVVENQPQEAVKLYKNAILLYPSKQYLWKGCSELVDDPELRIALLCKAVNINVDESFLGKCRLALANLLIGKQLHSAAKAELDKIRHTYEAHGWALRWEFQSTERALPAGTAASDNSDLYAHYFAIADEFIYSDLPEKYAVKASERMVDDRNRPGRKVALWELATETDKLYLRKPRKYGLTQPVPDGAVLRYKVKGDRIVWIRACETAPQLDWLRVAEGGVALRTDRKGNPYAIVDGIFVPARLLKDVAEGANVVVTGTRQPDGRWAAVAVNLA